MIKDCDLIVAYLKELYNRTDGIHDEELFIDVQELRKLLISIGTRFNTQNGEAI